MSHRLQKLRQSVIACHMSLLVYTYWLFRDFPFLGGPIPYWWQAIKDIWAIIGVLSLIGLFWRRDWARWVGLTFYGLIAVRLLFMAAGFFVEGKVFDEISLEFLLVAVSICFPLVLFFGKEPLFPKGST